MFKKQTKVEVVRISVFVFLSKFINMIVLFLPLKILFVLSGINDMQPVEDIEIEGSQNILSLQGIENTIGRDVYIGSMIGIIAALFVLNVVLQIYKVKLLNRQATLIEKKKYEFRGLEKSHQVILKTYAPFCQLLGDILLILTILIILFLLNIHYALFYLGVIFIYGVIVEQWAFPAHQTKLMKKLGIGSKEFINVTDILIFLILFMGIVAVVLNTDMVVIIAILMLILVRLGNGALKSFFSCQIKLRQNYL